MNIVIPYTPRPIFNPYHAAQQRFAVSVAHRRAGKTVARVNKLIRKAAQCVKREPRFGYLAPYSVQAKDIAWNYLKYYAGPLIACGGKINESELSITLPRIRANESGAVIRLYGAENAERMRGVYFDGICVDEAQDISRAMLNTVILPCLADRQGWLDISGTPKGWENLLGQMYKTAFREPSKWFSQILRASETGILPKSELELQRSVMSENEYRQEYECDFDAAITGAVYGFQIAEAMQRGRLCEVPFNPEMPVNTSWDLGHEDATAIWFWQHAGPKELHIIRYYENFNKDIAHYCKFLHSLSQERGYVYGKHFVPHDARNRLLAAGGRSIVVQAAELGIKMTPLSQAKMSDSIEAARKTLEYCYFDQVSCEAGLDALRQYQYKLDKAKRIYSNEPCHDWTSHACDAFEIMARVWRDKIEVPIETSKPRFLNDATADELFWGNLETSNPRKVTRICI